MSHHGLNGTSEFPLEAHNNLPLFLKTCISQYSEARDKDILLCSLLPVVGLCLSDAKGKYDTDWHSPTLYMFITAPAASNKGIMKYARLLVQPIQDKLIAQSKGLMKAYKIEQSAWLKRKKLDPSEPAPEKPPMLALLFPGNTTAAAFHSLLHDNQGRGLVIETEGDCFSKSLDSKFGDFSDTLRMAYHHETLSLTRKGNDEYYEIKYPRLAILLSGTPEQVRKLIPSTENGLFSRFLFYCYQRPLKWKDVTPCFECEDLDSFFLTKGKELQAIAEQVSLVKPTFQLTKEQFNRLNEFFRVKLERIKRFEGEDAASSLNRLGVISFRLCLILSILRSSEKGTIGAKIVCEEVDFTTALQLTEVFFEHTMLMYSLLPKTRKTGLKPHLHKFYEHLPEGEEGFTRKAANEIGEQVGIKEKSVYNYLQELIELGYLRGGNGKYFKVKLAP